MVFRSFFFTIYYLKSKPYLLDVFLVEWLRARWALSHPVFDPQFNAFQAEHVVAPVDNAVLLPIVADVARKLPLHILLFETSHSPRMNEVTGHFGKQDLSNMKDE